MQNTDGLNALNSQKLPAMVDYQMHVDPSH